MKENKTYQVCHEQKCHRCAVDKNDIDKLRASAVNLHSVLERLTTSKVKVFGGSQRHLTPFSLICCVVILKRVLSENSHKHMNISDLLKGLGSATGLISRVSSVTKKLSFITNVI
jgi:UDP-N-acetylglucosamine enolpyruvyl transferase